MTKNINEYIDHTLLKPEANIEQIQNLCSEAITYKFFSVCVNPHYVKLCKKLLIDSNVKVCTVVGFPLGATTTEIKKLETQKAIEEGADEIDMVLNIGEIKSQNFDYVFHDIKEIVDTCHEKNKLCKVIIETSLLSEKEKIHVCQIVSEAKADFIKTSTGFSGGGATVEDVMLMKKNISPDVKIKASGGIKNFTDASKMIEAGASRLGTSSGVAIIKNESSKETY